MGEGIHGGPVPALGLSFANPGGDGDSLSEVPSGSVTVTSIDFNGRTEYRGPQLRTRDFPRDIDVLLDAQVDHEVVNGVRPQDHKDLETKEP